MLTTKVHPGLVFADRQMIPDKEEEDDDSDDEEYELGEVEDSDDEVSDEIINDDLSQASEEHIPHLPNNVDNNDVTNDHVDNSNVINDPALPEENIVDVNADLINGNETIVKLHEPADEHMEFPGVGNEQDDLMEILGVGDEQDDDGPGVGDEQDDGVSQQGDINYDPGVNLLEDTIAYPEEEVKKITIMIQLSLWMMNNRSIIYIQIVKEATTNNMIVASMTWKKGRSWLLMEIT